MKQFFFLGKQDAEMVEIKKILVDHNLPIKSKPFNNRPRLSDYSEELKALTTDVQPVFIELDIDIPYPDNSIIIEHHAYYHHKENYKNNAYHTKSSLEQIALLVGTQLTYEQKLIAENDKGGINALKKICTWDNNIQRIRQYDKQCQSMTEQDEKDAEQSIKNQSVILYTHAILIHSLSETSVIPIIDQCCEPYHHIFIITPENHFYYYGTWEMTQLLKQVYEQNNQNLSFGFGGIGQLSGYFEANQAISYDKICAMIKPTAQVLPYSEHTFVFPFKIEPKPGHNHEFKFKESALDLFPEWSLKPYIIDFNLHELKPKSNELENASDCSKIKDYIATQCDNYNDYFYFYDFVRQAIFYRENTQIEPIVYYFEKEIANDSYMIITIKGMPPMKLTIRFIALHIFETGVGLLSIGLQNKMYSDFKDILLINDFGRRIYPQFLSRDTYINATHGAFLPYSIELAYSDSPKTYPFTFKHFRNLNIDSDGNYEVNLAQYIYDLLGRPFCDQFYPSPVMDDRMFVLCWYANNDLIQSLQTEQNSHHSVYAYETSEEWYKYIFIDGKYPSCQHKTMLHEIITKCTYERWLNDGTLYGITRYSLSCLTNQGGISFVQPHMNTMYYQFVIILLAQRASILKFSSEVSAISGKIKMNQSTTDIFEAVKALDKNVLHFVNRIWFTEVTPQEQGIEMYKLAHQNMELPEQVRDLKAEIKELYDFVSLETERKSAAAVNSITILGALFIPLTIITGLWGMNMKFLNYFAQRSIASFVFFVVSFVLLFAITILLYQKIQSNSKFIHWISKHKSFLLICLLVIALAMLIIYNDIIIFL